MRAAPSRPPFVLMYHSVAEPSDDPYHVTVSPARFVRQMSWLGRRGLRGVSMRDLLEAHTAGKARGLVGLTFDDGYADFTTDVMPVLARQHFTATVFVVAGCLGRQNDWDPLGVRKPLMTAEQVRCVADSGIEVGSHGMHHRALPTVDETMLVQEVEHSRKILQDLVGSTVDGFCYPYGSCDKRITDTVRAAGYEYACATWSSGACDRYALPRTYVGEGDHTARLAAKRLRHWQRWEQL